MAKQWNEKEMTLKNMDEFRNIEKNIDAFQWYLFEQVFNYPAWLVWSPLSAYLNRLDQLFGVGYFRGLYFFKNGDLWMFNIEGEMEKAGEELLERDIRDKTTLSLILKRIDVLSKELIEKSNNFKKIDVTRVNNVDLAKMFEDLITTHNLLWVMGQAINLLEQNSSFATSRLKKLLLADGVPEEKIINILNVLTTPSDYSYSQKEEQDILALAKKEVTPESLRAHWQKYAWLGYNWSGPAYDEKYFKERIDALKKDRDKKKFEQTEIEYRLNTEHKKGALIDQFNLTEETVRMGEIIEKIIYLKAFRVDASWFFYWIIEPLFHKIARQCFLSFEQVQFLKPQEIIALLEGGSIDENILNQRRKMFAISFRNGQIEECVGEVAEKLFEAIQKKLSSSDQITMVELKGEVGCPGIASGMVKIINIPEDIPKMKKGDILVSHTTNPRLVPAMKLAAAVVADIGGVTSHAAIISRELGIPCVIGTKKATRVLKDGMRVEVNANNGIIKIL